MFGIMPGETELSNLALEQLLEIQMTLFDGLGLSYRVLDMPPIELGNPAYRKFDIEAELPGKGNEKADEVKIDDADAESNPPDHFYGEISSCSSCTDYQSRRLNIKDSDSGQFCHTVNGTACAVPRMIMALCEQYQTLDGSISIPEKLQKYMRNDTAIRPKDKKLHPSYRYMVSPKKIVDKLKSRNVKSNPNAEPKI